MNDRADTSVTRRRFLQGAAAAAGIGAVSPGLAAQTGAGKPKFPTGPLGRTKLQVTKVSYGSLNTAGGGGRALIKATLDAGVNMLHTSSTYKGGNTIKAVGEFFGKNPGVRDKLVLCLKGAPERVPALRKELDSMLKTLGTDHVDVYLPVLHNADKRHLGQIMEYQDALKKEGKIRFKGFVCHKDMNGVLSMVLAEAPDYFDAALLRLQMIIDASKRKNDDNARFGDSLTKLKKRGLGVISMKTGARKAMEAGAEAFQAHCKTLLAGGADTVCYTFANLQQVDHLKRLDLTTTAMGPLEGHLAAELHCRQGARCLSCDRCSKSCPQGIPVCDLMRIEMYQDEYRDVDYARDSYRELGGDFGALAAKCGSCTACSDACPIGLASAKRVRYVTSLFA